MKRVVVNFATSDHGDFRIKQPDEAAQDAALCLTSQSKQNKIVPREQRVHDLRYNGVVVPVYAGEKRLVSLDRTQQIRAKFVLHRALQRTCVKIRHSAQLSHSFWAWVRRRRM